MATKLQISIDLGGPAGQYLQPILGLKPKCRKQKKVYIEEGLLALLEEHHPSTKQRYGDLSDMVNLGLIYLLQSQDRIKR